MVEAHSTECVETFQSIFMHQATTLIRNRFNSLPMCGSWVWPFVASGLSLVSALKRIRLALPMPSINRQTIFHKKIVRAFFRLAWSKRTIKTSHESTTFLAEFFVWRLIMVVVYLTRTLCSGSSTSSTSQTVHSLVVAFNGIHLIRIMLYLRQSR